MKQRLAATPQTKTAKELTTSDAWTVWQSPVGWTAVLEGSAGLRRVLIGYATRSSLDSVLRADSCVPLQTTARSELCDRLDAYFSGTPDGFKDVRIAPLWSTLFQRAVVAALRQIGCGETTTYADLAAKAGSPGAARAVGQVMATNPVPIVVPCHRVLASNGQLGGFSAPTGVTLKQWLLDLEAPAQQVRKPR